MRLRLGFLASLPERLVRSIVALAGGAVHETASLLLPRFVRRSRLYEATAKNALRIAIELVGGGDDARKAETETLTVRRLAVRKGAGNAVELGALVAFSPLWLLAGASDVLRGTRVYLDEFVSELRRAGVLAQGTRFETVDDLLGALEGASGRTARLIDIPPLALSELRETLAELRDDASSLPSLQELARLFTGLRNEATREQRSLLEVSTGIGLAFVVSAHSVGNRHLTRACGLHFEESVLAQSTVRPAFRVRHHPAHVLRQARPRCVVLHCYCLARSRVRLLIAPTVAAMPT